MSRGRGAGVSLGWGRGQKRSQVGTSCCLEGWDLGYRKHPPESPGRRGSALALLGPDWCVGLKNPANLIAKQGQP